MSLPPKARFAELAIDRPLDGLFTYKIPDGMDLQIGHAVLVPFGRTKATGYVIGLRDTTDFPRTKRISRLLDQTPAFDESMLPFFQWISNYYLSGLGEVISTALPKSYKAKSIRCHLPTEAGINALAHSEVTVTTQAQVLREIIAAPGRTIKGLCRRLDKELDSQQVMNAATALIKKGWAQIDEKESGGPRSMIQTVHLIASKDQALEQRGARQLAAINALLAVGGTMDVIDLVRQEGPTIRSALKRLEKKQLVSFSHREDRTGADFKTLPASSKPHPPNDQQQKALDAICSGEARPYLLHGVTGAGKTEIYLQAAQHYLNQGKQALILVPEIALTPLLIGRFRARFGNRVAALHSGLKSTERLQEWRKIRAGEASIAVGARSALFAPFANLGLIVVDEEHDDSYKQGDGVRYNARDLAVVRGKLDQCPVVLGSATPSVETWHNAQSGKYKLLRITKRATSKPVPNIKLIDMRGQPPSRIIHPQVELAIRGALKKGGKAIVLYNRRGYAPVVECAGCGGHFECPSCGVSLVLHKKSHKLSCHYCGFYQNYSPDCPQCNTRFDIIGYGSERVEEELQTLFPSAGISRMDADTTASRGAHHRILEGFRSGQSNLLVGTQLVAKGHDFPNVTLAAVVGVDHILTLPDFRSAERTYALVTQLAGRAGRGDKAGKVLVQTRHPDHFVFRLLSSTDLPDPGTVFYQQESRQRKILKYPPDSKLMLVRMEGENREKVQRAASQFGKKLRSMAHGTDIAVLGPVSAPMSKLVGRWRFQIIIRGQNVMHFMHWLKSARPILRSSNHHGVRISLDMDPRNLL